MDIKEKVIEFIQTNGKMTQNEIVRFLCKDDPNFINGSNSIMSLVDTLNELVKCNTLKTVNSDDSKDTYFDLSK